MSIKVPLDELPTAMAARGAGYLLTTPSDDDRGRPHVMHVRFEPTEDGADGGPRFRTSIGRSATRNIGAQPAVTLLFPPDDEGGYSLIVDAAAVVEAGEAVVTPVDAVLHRPA